MEAIDDTPAREALPSEQAIGREEEALLWRSLGKIPELYREPLILYYREHQSIEHVAVELELSEDAVKQRLSRGRKMLQEEVQTFVESALRRTAPDQAFSGAVLAALPLAAGPAVAAGAGAGVKGTAAAKAGFLAAFATPFLGIFAGFAAQWMMVRGTTANERRTRKIELIVAWISVLVFAIGGQFGVRSLAAHYRWNDRLCFAAVAGFWWFYAMVMATWIIVVFRHVQAIVKLHRGAGAVGQKPPAPVPQGKRLAAIAGTHLMLFWAVIFMAWKAHDQLAAAIIAGIMVILAIWSFFDVRDQEGLAMGPAHIRQLAWCSAVMLAIFNLRFDVWVAAWYGIGVSEVSHAFPTGWIVPVR